MASITTYTDPGVYTQELTVSSGASIPSLGFTPVIIGTGSRFKRVVNEQVVRGIVSDETITVASTSGAHYASLANRSDRRLETMSITKTLAGVTSTVSDAYVSFRPAYIETGAGTFNLGTDNAFGLELDGITPVTIVARDLLAYSAGSITISVASGVVTLTRASATFLTDGVRPGHLVTVANAEDTTTNVTDAVITAVTETTITYADANAVAMASSPDTAATLAFSGTAAVGREIHVFYNVTNIAEVTVTELADIINQALGSDAAEDLGYGTDLGYNACAAVVGSACRITSQAINSDGTGREESDVRACAAIATNASTVIFGASTLDATTIIDLENAVYSASATYKATYARLADDTDPLENTDVETVVAVSSSPGNGDYKQFEDYQLTSDTIDWSLDAAAVVTGVAGNYVLAAGTIDTIEVAIDNKVGSGSFSDDIVVTIDLIGMSPAPLGYAAISSPGAATPTEVAANVNAVLAAALGPRYKAVASVASSKVVLTSPSEGSELSAINVWSPTTASATSVLFGSGVTTVSDIGEGKRPAAGETYYVTYDYARPTSEYNVPILCVDRDAAYAQVGMPSVSTAQNNPLAMAADIAFRNRTPYLYVLQINDSISEGVPTRSQVQAALEEAAVVAGCTEICVVGEPGTRLDVAVDIKNHVEENCSLLAKRPRRAFLGMANGTAIGSRGVTDSLIGRASRTLQVANTSAGRGRLFLFAPPQLDGVTHNFDFEDGTNQEVEMDGTYLGVAFAAQRCGLSSPALTMTNRAITGFNIADITAPWKAGERRLMASQGVNVVTFDGSQLIFMDAISTEGGGSNENKYKIDSTSYQKDTVVSKVDRALFANIQGKVPEDLASFLLDIKRVIQSAVDSCISNKEIGPYTTESGQTRNSDINADYKALRDVNDTTKYLVRYAFNLRYPALRVFADYVVDISLDQAGLA